MATSVERRETNRAAWSDPYLLVFGTIEGLTLARNKNVGTGDAFTFQNQSTTLSH